MFNCIDFNQRFRCADLAFLAMDLAHLGRADLAGAFVDAYLLASRDAEPGELLDSYTCYRADIRGNRLRLDEPDLNAPESRRIRAEASAYFNLAWAAAGGPVVLACRADEALLHSRLAARSKEPGINSDALLELRPALRATFVEPDELREAQSVDTQQPADASLREALALLKREAAT